MAGDAERLARLVAAREAVAEARAAAGDLSRPYAERVIAQDLLVTRVEELAAVEAADPARLAAEAAEAEALQKAAEWVPAQKALIAERQRLASLAADPSTAPPVAAAALAELAMLPRAG